MLALTVVWSLSAAAQQTSEADYEARLQKLKGLIEQLNRELQAVKGSRDELQSKLQQSETEIADLVKKIERLQGELKQEKQQLQQLNKEREQLHDARREQQKHIAQQVSAAYRLGQQGNLKLLLNQESPARVSRMLKYYDYFLTARANKINTYLDTINDLNRVEPQIQQKAQQLAQNKSRLQERHSQLDSRQQERQRTLAKLNRAIDSKDAQLRKLAADRQRLQQLLDQVAAAVASIALPGGDKPFGQLKGKLPWPTKGKMRHHFGSARVAGKLNWDGVLIQAPAGREVRAVHHGRVVFADYLRGQGLLLIIDHGGGYMSLYAHNQTLLRETGDWVSGGETVATVGNSGGRSRAGLYFEIRHQGNPTDPARWLTRNAG